MNTRRGYTNGKRPGNRRENTGKSSRSAVCRMNRTARIGIAVLVVLTVFLAVRGLLFAGGFLGSSGYGRVDVEASEPEIDVQLLDVNPYSRPGTQSNGITGIVIHYTANPGSTAQGNRDYFNGLQFSHETKASSNFVVGLDGEIIQCIPTWEVAYASNDRNYDSVSIEVCHPDESGKFTEESYKSLVQLTAWLCVKFDLTADDVIRHYDVTGKNCPKYFVEHEDEWEQFKENVSLAITSEN